MMLKLALFNIKGKKFKYSIMFLLLFITSIGIYASDILLQSMEKGLITTKEQIGADIIVVPEGFVSEVDDALFKGKACTLNFDRKWEYVLQDMEGVKNISSQLYIATLSGVECCDGEAQLIAVDFKNDFSICPWTKEDSIRNLSKDEIILGSAFDNEVGDFVNYYNKKFKVKYIMSETGAGYDKSLFISYEAAIEMIADEKNKNMFPFNKGEDLASMVLIQVDAGVDPMSLKSEIEKSYGAEGIAVYGVTTKINELLDKMMEFKMFGTILNVWVTVIVVIALFAVNAITTFQRKNEIGSMLTVGIEKRKIIYIFLLEYIVVSMAAIISSIFLINVFVYFFQNHIKNILELPFILIYGLDSLKIVLKLIVINILVLIGSVISSFYWIYKRSPSEMIKQFGNMSRTILK